MFVTQNRSAARSDQERRQRNMCYIRIICMVLVASLTLSAMVSPASAADTELYYQDILQAGSYTQIINGAYSSSSSVTPVSWFDGVNSCGFRWDGRPYDHSYTSFVFTLRISGNGFPSKVEFSHYSTRIVEATFLSRHGEYAQYRVDLGSNIAWLEIEAFFDSAFRGTFAIFSCFGIRDIGVNIGKASSTQRATFIPYNSPDVDIVSAHSKVNEALPFGHDSKRSKSYSSWLYDTVMITVPYDNYKLDAADSITFLIGGQLATPLMVDLCNNDDLTVHILDNWDAVTISNSVKVGGIDDIEMYYQQITADLSGYDLKNMDIRLTFRIEPTEYSDTYNQTFWTCESIDIRLPVVDVPWYKVFWQWVSDKWTSVSGGTNKILTSIDNKISNLFGSSKVSQQLSNAGDAMSDQAVEMNQAQDQLNSIDKPSLDTNGLFGTMLNFNPGGLKILTAITNNGQVTAMLVVVFTFALCGYIFFGKKG